MIIHSSSIQMQATRTYTQSENAATKEELTFRDVRENSLNNTLVSTAVRKSKDSLTQRLVEIIDQLRERLLELSQRSIHSSNSSMSNWGYKYNWGHENNSVLDLTNGTLNNVSVWNRTRTTTYTYQESEQTAFSSTGTVATADGRTFDFQMKINMSREYLSQTNCIKKDTISILTDPLVINLKNAPTNISHKCWEFDIDTDGVKESLHMLQEGSAYLALDRNHNGSIDNGSELFGTLSGNGFVDLAQYDTDGNGWIDENDTIYKELMLWKKDDAGNDVLASLKEFDIGAICLGSVSSEFALKETNSNTTTGEIRASGIYIKESGTVGTIQQVDFATKFREYS